MHQKARLFLGIGAAVIAAVAASCSVYDESLLEPTGGGGSGQGAGPTTSSGGAGGAGGSGGSGGTGGVPECATPADCPGADTECAARTCDGGVCGVAWTAGGTPLQQQAQGDCQEVRCDGMGGEISVPDDADLPDDSNECTANGCNQGSPVFTPLPDTSCATGHCNAMAQCVECTQGSHCMSGVCSALFTCAAPTCTDAVQNGDETDVDCGGMDCGDCATGLMCGVNEDCIGGLCAGTCQPTCTDTVTNNGETDVDCGGPNCGACAIGQMCAAATDCVSGVCGPGGACLPRVVISELRSFGPGGATDEFIELYNPMSVPVVLDNTWKIEVRSSTAGSYVTRWTGSGATLPPNSHYLIGGAGYVQMPTKDANLSSGITDASSVRLVYGAEILDILCYYTDAASLATLQGAGYTCEGMPKQNLTGAANNTKSMERLPGGMLGNGTDTNDNAADFATIDPANPQSLASAPTP